MKTPDSYEFRSLHNEDREWGPWSTCTPARSVELSGRLGFEVRALYLAPDALQKHVAALEASRADEMVRLRLAMASIRTGETEIALSILRSVTKGP